jgi:hypothetical protein
VNQPIRKETFLLKTLQLVRVIQIGSTLFMLVLVGLGKLSLVTYNGQAIQATTYMGILVIQCICSWLLLTSLVKKVLRRKAWLIWLLSWGLGEISFIAQGISASFRSSLSIFGAPLMIASLVLIIATHSYVKEQKKQLTLS